MRRGSIEYDLRRGSYKYTIKLLYADELAEDLLVLLADGLNEERLAALLKRWSKAWRKASKGIKEMDSLD